MFDKGRPLNTQERTIFEPYFQLNTLNQARITENHTPFWLHKKMCAVVLGAHIYFRKDAFQFNSQNGIELLAHELTHVEQYLAGMTVVKYLWASRYGYQNNPYEIEAYAKAANVRRLVGKSGQGQPQL